MTNKDTLKWFGKIVLIIVLLMIAFTSNIAVWNAAYEGAADSFYVAVSILNILLEVTGLYTLYKKLFI